MTAADLEPTVMQRLASAATTIAAEMGPHPGLKMELASSVAGAPQISLSMSHLVADYADGALMVAQAAAVLGAEIRPPDWPGVAEALAWDWRGTGITVRAWARVTEGRDRDDG